MYEKGCRCGERLRATAGGCQSLAHTGRMPLSRQPPKGRRTSLRTSSLRDAVSILRRRPGRLEMELGKGVPKEREVNRRQEVCEWEG
jgi:hypothetical protein